MGNAGLFLIQGVKPFLPLPFFLSNLVALDSRFSEKFLDGL